MNAAGTLASVFAELDAVPVGSPPSTYAGYDVVTGKAGGVPRMLLMTGLRATLIVPGLYLAGMRDPRRLAKSAVFASAGISLFVLGHTWWNHRDAT